MARLVVVSNRVPLPSERGPRAGGLAVALADALRPGIAVVRLERAARARAGGSAGARAGRRR